jgi:hypothetical protein
MKSPQNLNDFFLIPRFFKIVVVVHFRQEKDEKKK